MLTEDENIVSVNFAIQYDIKDASDFIFNLRDPDETLRAAGESSIREVLGKNKMDFVITEGREAIASSTKIFFKAYWMNIILELMFNSKHSRSSAT